MERIPTRRDFLMQVAMAALIPPALRATEARGPVVLGNVSLSFYAVTGAVVAAVLERLGHRVEIVDGSHEQIFPLLGNDSIDLLAAAWLPEGHAAYWSRHGTKAEEVTTLYEGARFFWAVPAYVPATEVSSIADLARPEVAARMTRTIQGIGDGAAISTLSRHAIDRYGLAAPGYEFRPGTQAQWIESHRAALAARRWMVFPTWMPQYLNRDGGLRPLADPRGVFGGSNRAVLVGSRARLSLLPAETRRVLSRIQLGIDAVTQMDWDVNVGGATPRNAAMAWIAAHQFQVNGWFGATSL